jgi:hypothetical protein
LVGRTIENAPFNKAEAILVGDAPQIVMRGAVVGPSECDVWHLLPLYQPLLNFDYRLLN